jgi:tetratricopeptide (TPR) repeat protein
MSTGSELQIKATRLFEKGKYEDAAEVFTEALEAYQEEGTGELAAEMRVNLGLAKRELGDFEAAITEMQTGLAYFKETEDQLREAQTLGNMALAYAKADDEEQAQTMYREAGRIFREIGEDEYYGETILALADMLFRSGHLVEALATFEVGLEHVRNKNHRQKMMKQLLVLKNRLSGERRQEQVSDGDEAVSDSRRRRRRRGRGLFGRNKDEETETSDE